MHASLLLITGLFIQDVPTASPETVLDEIVVNGSLNAPAFDPFGPFETICFDANRRQRTALVPREDDPVWIPLNTIERRRLGLLEQAKAFQQQRSDLSLLLRIEEGLYDGPVDGIQLNRCVLTIVGPHDPTALRLGMSRLFGTTGTQDHVERVKGYAAISGWQQWAWTAMPNKHTSQWRGFDAAEGIDYVVVARPFFYRSYAWVIADLKFSEVGAVPVSELSLSFRYKP